MLFDPRWNKFVKEYDRALDPLGMNRVTDRILNDLLLGITTVTPRARYYSFYLWAINQIIENKWANTAGQFKTAFSNLERAFMLSCVAHEEESGKERGRDHNDVNGSFRGWEIWKENSTRIPLDFSYFGHMLGGYGQYYRGAIASLGLTRMDKEDIYEQPTDLGRSIAESFNKSAKQTTIVKLQAKAMAAKDVFYHSGRKLCLCRLVDGNDSERDLLTRLFFGFLNQQSTARAMMRRYSLSLMLHLSNAIELTDNISDAGQDFMDMCYFGQVWDYDKKRATTIKIPRHLTDVASRWKVFRAHDYFAYATESILTTFLDFLSESEHTGGTLHQFINRATDQGLQTEFSKLMQITTIDNPVFPDIPVVTLINLIAKNIADIESFATNMKQTSREFDLRVNMNTGFNEFKAMDLLEVGVYGGESKEPDPNIVYCSWPALMIAVFMRFYWRFHDRDPYWQWLLLHSRNDPSVARFIHDLGAKLESNQAFTVREFIAWFIERFVIDEARQVYTDKLSDSIYSRPKSWFHRTGAAFVKDRDYSARHRNFRFASVTSILRDIGLISFANDMIKITSEGRKMLSSVENGGSIK